MHRSIELLGTVTRLAFADDEAALHIEHRERRGRSVAPLVVHHGRRAALLQG